MLHVTYNIWILQEVVVRRHGYNIDLYLGDSTRSPMHHTKLSIHKTEHFVLDKIKDDVYALSIYHYY